MVPVARAMMPTPMPMHRRCTKSQGQVGDPEKGRDAGRIEQQPGKKDGTAAAQGKQVAGQETADEAADDHDARGEPGAAELAP